MGDRTSKIKALVVDDAAFMRKALVEMLSRDREIEVVGVAKHGEEALRIIDELNPDVITLDVDMPVMDGLTTIKHIMIRDPRPVVMISALANQGEITLEALRLGAVDFFPKPSGTVSYDIRNQARELTQLVKQAAKVNCRAIKRAKRPVEPLKVDQENIEPGAVVAVVADIGASACLIRMLANINPSLPLSFLCCQGLSGDALRSYTSEMDLVLPWQVSCSSPVTLNRGNCLLTWIKEPWSLQISEQSKKVRVRVGPDQDLDQMLEEIAMVYGSRAAAVVLGGTTENGIRGMKAIRDKDGLSLVLEPRYCVCDQTARLALDAGVAKPVSEHLLWTQIETFGKKHAETAGIEDQMTNKKG